MLFSIGDYLAGILIGIATTFVVRSIVRSGMDMVLAMLIGMAAGMIVHLLLGLILGPLVGMFETMMPASLIGMYGGMLFGMRDSMAAGSLTLSSAAAVGGFSARPLCSVSSSMTVFFTAPYLTRTTNARSAPWTKTHSANGMRRVALSTSSASRRTVA